MKPEPIWHPTETPAVYLRYAFTASAEASSGHLRCACSGAFQLSLDSALLGAAPPHLTEACVWWEFALPRLRTGAHELVVYAAAGEPGTPPWFAADGGWDARTTRVLSDSSWQALAVPQPARADIEVSERHAAMEDPRHAAASLADSSAWQAAAVVATDSAPVDWQPRAALEEERNPRRLVARGEVSASGPIGYSTHPAPPSTSKCVNADSLAGSESARAIIGTTDGSRAAYILLDFGRVAIGRVRLRLQTETDGGVIDLGFAAAEGAIDSRFRYVCGRGRQEWTALRPRRCRYLALRFSQCHPPIELEAASLVVRTTEVGEGGSTSFDAAGLSGLWEVGYASVAAARQEVYRGGCEEPAYDWLGALPAALNDFYLSGDTMTARVMLTTARVDGANPADLPRLLPLPLLTWHYLMHSGDEHTTRAALAAVGQILDALIRLRRDDEQLASTPSESPLSPTALKALAAGALDAGARLSELLEGGARAPRWRAELHLVRGDLQQAWSEGDQLFAESAGRGEGAVSQFTNGLILLFGLATDDQRALMTTAFRSAQRPRNLTEAFFATWGAWQAGAEELATERLESFWVQLLERDGRTWCHKAGEVDLAAPGPDYLLGSHVLGVKPLGPGFADLEVRPPRGVVERAEGTVQTRAGSAAVAWWRGAGGGMRIRYGSTCDGESHLAVPRGGLKFPTVALNGETIWRNEKVYPNTTVRDIIAEPSYIVLIVRGPGQFEVTVE